MRKFTARLIVASLTFLLGIAATVWYVNRPRRPQIMPVGRWEPVFFNFINERTGAANLPALRTVALRDGDLEVRIWVGFGISGGDGFILRRSADEWSAIHLRGTFDRHPPPKCQEQMNLAAPKSGWNRMWQRLVDAEILTLPDALSIDCRGGALDGVSYVVEINADRIYRAYLYDNPQLAKCGEAKKVVAIGDILFEEFGLYRQPE
jgi:hypothetical protein